MVSSIYLPSICQLSSVSASMLSIIRLSTAPHVICVQAARVLDEILVIVPRHLTTANDLQAKVQRLVLDVLSQQVTPESNSNTGVTIDLRRMGLETLHQILQSSGHTPVIGWETIFEMLCSVCKPATPFRLSSLDSISVLGITSPPVSKPKLSVVGLGTPSERGYTSLIKIAFQSDTCVRLDFSSFSRSSPFVYQHSGSNRSSSGYEYLTYCSGELTLECV